MGCLYSLKLAMHHMKNLWKGGRIMFTGSANSYIPLPSQVVYLASKHAVLGMMRSASRRTDCADAGISVCLLAPWTTYTRLTSSILDQLGDLRPETSQPKDLAWAAEYICFAEPKLISAKGLWVQGSKIKEVEEVYAENIISHAGPRNDWLF
jgi:NAD(P)-dependent dehydrogenase (short-subunit alcohol dehydrogenase family)